MSEDILEKFFYGGFIPAEQMMPRCSDYSQAVAVASRIENTLKTRLSDSDFALFEEFKQEHAKIESIQEANRFIYGWKLGSKFTLTTFIK